MIDGKKIIAMIPARMGSQRLPRKNTALIAGQPLVGYAIDAAKACPYFDEIVVNTNDPKVKEIAKQKEVSVFDRSEEKASSSAKSDEVVQEFLESHPCDIICWINTTSPLQPHGEIKRTIDHFNEKRLDSLFTVYEESVHCNMNQEGINYKTNELFAKTQDLPPVSRFVYSVMMWDSKAFLKAMDENGNGLFCGKTGTFPISKLTSLIVKNENDLMMVDYIARGLKDNSQYQINYYEA